MRALFLEAKKKWHSDPFEHKRLPHITEPLRTSIETLLTTARHARVDRYDGGNSRELKTIVFSDTNIPLFAIVSVGHNMRKDEYSISLSISAGESSISNDRYGISPTTITHENRITHESRLLTDKDTRLIKELKDIIGDVQKQNT